MNRCPKCNTEFVTGTKFCQNCGCNLENEIIENPVCPKCNKTFTAGAKFCDLDGTKLVSAEKMIPRCVKCGKQYPSNVKFCPEDGGEIKPEALHNTQSATANNFVESADKTISNVVDKGIKTISKITEKNKWNSFVTVWSIIALVINGGMLLKYLYDWGSVGFYYGSLYFLVTPICLSINILGVILLLNKKKTGFYLLCLSAILTFIATFVYHGFVSTFIWTLLSIGAWYGILQIRQDGVPAWSTLE